MAGSLAILLGSFGVGHLASSQRSLLARSGFVSFFRSASPGVVLCAAAVVLGVGLLLHAWLRLGRAVAQAKESGQSWGAADVLRVSLWWSLPLLFALPIFSRDVYSYVAQGRLMAQGGNPYTDWVSQMPGWFGEASDQLWAESASPYGPLFLLLAQLAWLVTGGVPELGVVVFRLLAAAGTLLSYLGLTRLMRGKNDRAAWGTWIVIANPLWILSMAVSAHNDSLMIGLTLLSFAAARKKHAVQAIVLAGCAVAIKPIVVLTLPFLGLALLGGNPRLRARLQAWVVVGGGAGLMLLAFGAITGLWFGWIPAMAGQGSASPPNAPFGLLALAFASLFGLLGASVPLVQSMISALGKVAAVAGTAWLALRQVRRSALFDAGIALSLAAVLSPVMQPWYALWVIPLLVATTPSYGRGEQLIIVLSAVLCLGTSVVDLSVPQWVSPVLMYVVASVVAVTCLALLAVLDPTARACAALRGPRSPVWAATASILSSPVVLPGAVRPGTMSPRGASVAPIARSVPRKGRKK